MLYLGSIALSCIMAVVCSANDQNARSLYAQVQLGRSQKEIEDNLGPPRRNDLRGSVWMEYHRPDSIFDDPDFVGTFPSLEKALLAHVDFKFVDRRVKLQSWQVHDHLIHVKFNHQGIAYEKQLAKIHCLNDGPREVLARRLGITYP